MVRVGTGRLGLRARVVIFFAFGAALVSLTLAVSVFAISRGYMVGQRERSAERQAASHAEVARNWLADPAASAQTVLTALNPPVETVMLLHWNDEWFSSTPELGPDSLPDELLERARESPRPVTTTVRGKPMLAMEIDLDDTGNALYEFAPLVELHSTLRVLRTVLAACAFAATVAGALLGWWASGRVLDPLHRLARAAADISGGKLETRLSPAADRDLGSIVASFNTMVDSLHNRIERERRFFGDVSHELRTPLTTLITSVGVLNRHADELPPRTRLALHLVTDEVDHLHRLLDDLLSLARTEAGLHEDALEPLALADLLMHSLEDSRRPTAVLTALADVTVTGRKLALERAFVNLMENADTHGSGLTAITLSRTGTDAIITFDDAGPSVPETERERIFERFVTAAPTRTASARTRVGTGLGLALVAETLAAHGGTVRCDSAPHGGARFVVTLPIGDDATFD